MNTGGQGRWGPPSSRVDGGGGGGSGGGQYFDPRDRPPPNDAPHREGPYGGPPSHPPRAGPNGDVGHRYDGHADPRDGGHFYNGSANDRPPAQNMQFGAPHMQSQRPSGAPAGTGPNAQDRSVFVGGLPVDYDDNRLAGELGRFGEVAAATVGRDTQGRARGFGIVEFRDPASATRACSVEVMTELGHL